MKATEKVRTALQLEKAASARANEWQKPKVDAKVSILNADLRDREIGITPADAHSNGLFIANAVLAAAGR